jgi:hypothetical protein
MPSPSRIFGGTRTGKEGKVEPEEACCDSGSGNGEEVPEQTELGDMRRPIGLSGYIWYE